MADKTPAQDKAADSAPPPADAPAQAAENAESKAAKPLPAVPTPETKEEAVNHLKALRLAATMLEDELKVAFYRYDTHTKGFWKTDELRNFLFDLLESFDLPKAVSDDALLKVLQELQLTSEQQVVKWVDFKSYAMYLQQQPFDHIKDLVVGVQGDLSFALIVDSLPAEVTADQVTSLFNPCGNIRAVFVVTFPQARSPQALVCFEAKEALDAGLQYAGRSVGDTAITVAPFLPTSQFPATNFVRKPTAVHRGLAKVYVGVKGFDEKHQISASIKKGAHKLSQKLNKVSEDLKLQERTQAVKKGASDMVKKVDQKLGISETATKVNEKYNISGRAQDLASKAQKNIEIGMSSKPVQQGLGLLKGLANRVQTTVSDFSDSTRAAIDSEQQKQQAGQGSSQAS